EANGQGKKLSPFNQDAIIYGTRTIYIYGNSLFIDNETPSFNQCIYETQFNVYNLDCQIPKGISPNGDGMNDTWDLTPFGVLKATIFNREGAVVYTKDDGYTNEWYGQTNGGGKVPSGTYFYSLQTINGPKTGWLEVIYELK